MDIDESLNSILFQYQISFRGKSFSEGSNEEDDLMLAFGISQEIKSENKQYWGRELGMCWQRIIMEICRYTRTDFQNAIREGNDEICDLIVGLDAIDTKYRIGSGDSGTLKKFRHYAARIHDLGYRPVLLILRNDNLPSAMSACLSGGWDVKFGNSSYEYLETLTGFDLKGWLISRRNAFRIF